MQGSQDFAADPRNGEVRIYVNGELVPRAEARVSVFDAGFVLGDGVWEGLRIHGGHPAVLEQHVPRRVQSLCRVDHPAAFEQQSHYPSPPSSINRSAMRTATPLVTWSVIRA